MTEVDLAEVTDQPKEEKDTNGEEDNDSAIDESEMMSVVSDNITNNAFQNCMKFVVDLCLCLGTFHVYKHVGRCQTWEKKTK